jgi:hypothetical protein
MQIRALLFFQTEPHCVHKALIVVVRAIAAIVAVLIAVEDVIVLMNTQCLALNTILISF